MKNLTFPRWCVRLAAAAVWAAMLGAQTSVDVKNQARNIDFSTAVATRPFKTGTTLPATCGVGETYFKTNAAPGLNLYACTATNTWTAMSSVTSSNSGPGAVEMLKAQSGGNQVTGRQLVTGEGVVVTQQTDTVTVETDTAIVPRYATAATAPTGSCQTGRDQFTRVSGFPHFYGCIDGQWKAIYAVSATAPSTCTLGELYFNSSNLGLFGCTSANQWTKFNQSGLDLSTVGECAIAYGCTPVGAHTRQALPSAAVTPNFMAVRTAIPHTIKLHHGFLFTLGGSSSSAFTMAVYQDAGGVPGNKIAGSDLRIVDLFASAFRWVIWGSGNVVLTPGVYWIGFSSESATAEFHINTLGNGWGNFLALMPGTPGAVQCGNPATGTGATYTLPGACGTASTAPSGFSDPPLVLATSH